MLAEPNTRNFLQMLTFLAYCLIGISGVDSTPVRPIVQYAHTRWTAKEGAPSETFALAQTTDGYLWLGTRSGLVRFDGVRFVPFVSHGSDTVPVAGVRSLLAGRDGSLWIVWGGGTVSRLREGRVTTYGSQDGLSVAHALAESSTGVVVAGTSTGLSQFAEGKWKDVGRAWQYPGTESRAVWFDRDDTLWAETEDRVVYLPKGATAFVDPGMKLRGKAEVAAFAQARDGTIWMAELSRSAHTLHQRGDRRPITEVEVGTWTLLIDRKGSLWVGSAGDGLRRLIDPSRHYGKAIAQFGPEAEHYTRMDGLLSDVVTALLEDREGSIWVATAQGLERFREGAFTPIATPGSTRPRVIFAMQDTSVWVAAYSRAELIRIGPGNQGTRTIETDFFPQTLFQDRSGNIWTAHGANVVRLEGDRFTSPRVAVGTAKDLVDVTGDSAGALWFFDQVQGLLRWTGDSLVQVASIRDPIWPQGALFGDRNGRIWVAQHTQLALYDQGQLRLFRRSEGEISSRVLRVYQDRAGNVWAMGEAGLSKFENGRFRTVPASFPGRAVFGVAEADDGAWWVVTRHGVVSLAAGEIERTLTDSAYNMQYRTFDQADGLPGMISSSMYGPLLARTPDGRIWVATDSGVAFVDPRHVTRPPAPRVLIEAALTGGKQFMPGTTTAFPPKTRDLEIDYTATTLAMPERVHFRYRLEGADEAWHDAGTRRRAYYTSLGPGTYRFQVIASYGDGIWNEPGTTWNFRVLPAWYQTFWFKAGVVLLIGALGGATVALVQRRRHQHEQNTLKRQYEATLAERARIAQDLHDTLLQGFAGVTLQLKAAERALPEHPDVATETLLRVQRLARESLKEARERVWDLRETALGSDDLATALETSARDRAAGTTIEVSLITMGDRRRLPRSLEVAAFHIGREAVANAIKHAVPNRIEIEVEFGVTTLRMAVRDDGRGFPSEEAEEARDRGHFGLSGIRDRAEHAGGRCEIQTREGGGTVVALELPLAEPQVH